jgi:hypothetical protein
VRVIEERDFEISEESGRQREATSSHLSKHAYIIYHQQDETERRKTWKETKDALDFMGYDAGTKDQMILWGIVLGGRLKLYTQEVAMEL